MGHASDVPVSGITRRFDRVGVTSGQERAVNSTGHTLVELRELRYFGALAVELHFGRAAERLHISQPPLSQTIANLERKLGTKLLDRTSRQVRLTSAGAVLRDRALRVLSEVDAAVAATREAALAEATTLRLAVSAPVRETLVVQIADGLARRFPLLVLSVTEVAASELVEHVLHGEADIGLAVSPAERNGLLMRQLRRERPAALVHRGSPLASRTSISIAELARHPLLIWPREDDEGAHDLVVGLFDGAPPASTTELERYDRAWWSGLVDGGFAVVPAGISITSDFALVPIEDSPAEFVTEVVWSDYAAPPILPVLLDALDDVAEAHGWL
jgi:DNA-binding transcriptional LysR family regulator